MNIGSRSFRYRDFHMKVSCRRTNAPKWRRLQVRQPEGRGVGRSGGSEGCLDMGGEGASIGAGVAAGRIDRPEFQRRQAPVGQDRSEEHTSELQSLMRIQSATFCLKKKPCKK